MAYHFEVTRRDGADLASGAVLRSAPGFPAYPLRLASEVFQRARQLLAAGGVARPLVLWDPCCGSGYLTTVVAMLHRADVAAVVASDVDPGAVALARRNLALLSRHGLAARRAELEAGARAGRASSAAAAASAGRLLTALAADGGDVPTRAGVADALDPTSLRELLAAGPGVGVGVGVDVVLTDVPYGEQTAWSGAPGAGVPDLLAALAVVLRPEAVVAVTARARKVDLGGAPAVRRLRVGTRAVALVRAGDVPGAPHR